MNAVSPPSPFRQAVPVWLTGRETEKNITAGFTCRFSGGAPAVLRLAAASVYRVFLNGRFLFHGPARAALGHCRVDVLELPASLLREENVLAIEVVSFYVNSYYVPKQPAFLQAEVCREDTVLCRTGVDGDFRGTALTYRLQKTQRFSFQRPCIDAFRVAPGYADWRAGIGANSHSLSETPPRRFLPRRVPYPAFRVRQALPVFIGGEFSRTPLSSPKWQDSSVCGIGPQVEGFLLDELDVPVSLILDGTRTAVPPCPVPEGQYPLTLSENRFFLSDLSRDLTGFIGIRLRCGSACHVIVCFDEILTDGDVSYNRESSACCISLECAPGSYTLETIQPFTCRYLKTMVLRGEVTVESVYLREYENPMADPADFSANDPALGDIFRAAKATFAQNAVDLYMDCPSRERGGWLCDSFFTARVEYALTGTHSVEDAFLENYALPASFPHLPDGMVPMCYPADHFDENYIANWALWLILETFEYRQRGGDPDLIARLEPRIRGILEFMSHYENSDGLLEDVPGWVFVEWSRANDLTAGVNYPSNMLYSAALRAAGVLYGDSDLLDKGRRLCETVRAASFDGQWFCDQALRSGGTLIRGSEATEVCQYYAFFFRVADAHTHPRLYRRMLEEFSPGNRAAGLHPQIAPANAFVGNYLRLELLSRAGLSQQILEEVKAFFTPMAALTGTLWEHMNPLASCDHGFASHAACSLIRDVLGLRRDSARHFHLHIPNVGLQSCQARLPLPGGFLEAGWQHGDGGVSAFLRLPRGYTAHITADPGLTVKEEEILPWE